MPTPDFIVNLRKKIGNDPLWLVGITAYVEDGEGRILLGRRADTGEWALIYGINEPGEEPADTVVREVKEETGVDVVPIALAGVKASSKMVVYSNGDQTQYLDLLFECRLAQDGIIEPSAADEESLEVGWFDLEALPSPLSASTVERIERVRAYKAACDAGDASAHFACTLSGK